MRHLHHLTLPLSLLPLLLLLHCAVECLGVAANRTHRCIFDEVMRLSSPMSTAVVRELPRAGLGTWQAYTTSSAADTWAPIRIKVFTEDMENPSKYCAQPGEWRSDFFSTLLLCTGDNVLTPEKKNILINSVIPSAVKMHTDRLLVQPVAGNLVLPEFYNSLCNNFTVPHVHKKTGVPNADMVLYAAAGPMNEPAAWGASCSSFVSGRPLAGVFNYDPKHAVNEERHIRMGAHEIAHALGFGYEQMVHSKMVTEVNVGRGKQPVFVVNSSRTKEKARAHYGCQRTPGMELENEGAYGTEGSHWERRNAKDELMAGISGASLYTALTMAAFEDMGFYRANWGMEETMNWGRNAGCDFLEKSCVENGVVNFPNMFCDKRTLSDGPICTFDRKSLGFCQTNALFAELMDGCPYVQYYSNAGCMNAKSDNSPGSLVGPNSRCVKGDSLKMPYYLTTLGDICVDVSCENDSVKIRYIGDDNWYECFGGQYITPNKTFSSGRILCPEPSEVCPPIRQNRSVGGTPVAEATSSFGGNHSAGEAKVDGANPYILSSAANMSPFSVLGVPIYIFVAMVSLAAAVTLF